MSKAEELRDQRRRADWNCPTVLLGLLSDAIAALEAAEARDRERNTRGFRRVVRADRLKKEKQP